VRLKLKRQMIRITLRIIKSQAKNLKSQLKTMIIMKMMSSANSLKSKTISKRKERLQHPSMIALLKPKPKKTKLSPISLGNEKARWCWCVWHDDCTTQIYLIYCRCMLCIYLNSNINLINNYLIIFNGNC
jgi:hypothetical protein